MSSCTLESRQKAAADMVVALVKEKGKGLSMEQVSEYKFRVQPNRIVTPRNLLLRLSQLQESVTKSLAEGSDKEFHGDHSYGWVTRKQLSPKVFELEVKVPDRYTKALEVFLGVKTLAEANKAMEIDRLKFMNYDRALYEQELRENREEESDIFVNQETGLPEWNHDSSNDKQSQLSNSDLYELMKIKKC